MDKAPNGENDDLTFPCRICGRKFVRSSLEKHEPACKKLTKMQRKVFDSGKQRASGSDVPLTDVRKAAKDRQKVGGVFPRPQTHWRERHEDFIGALSASKQVGKALKTGQPLPPPPKTAGTSSDYTHCEFCGRTFSQNAAERHIAFCKEKSVQKAVKERSASKSSSSRRDSESDLGSGEIGGKTDAFGAKTKTAGKPTAKESESTIRIRSGSVGPPGRMSSVGGGGGARGTTAGGTGGDGMPGKKTAPTGGTLSQANKRSISAPKKNGQQTLANGAAISSSKFCTPKSAGSTKGRTSAASAGGTANAPKAATTTKKQKPKLG